MHKRDEFMPKNNRPSGSIVPTIRDCTVIVAAIVATWSFITYDKSPSTESHSASVTVQEPDAVLTKNEAIVMGHKTSEPAMTAFFNRYSKERVEEINNQGEVVKRAVVERQNPSPGEPTQAADQGNPHLPKGKGVVANPTFNPPPFVDEQAKESILERAVAAQENGNATTFKITHHSDGTRMTRVEQQENVRTALSEIPDEWTITYKSPNERIRAYVFTDTTCPFCKRLHDDMDKLLDAGVTVHYLLYPRDQVQAREGFLSVNATNMANAWCAPDQKQAIDDSFLGYRVPTSDCADLPDGTNRYAPPVPDHFNLGEYFGVVATPTVFLSNGHSFAGYSSLEGFLKNIQ